MKLETHGLPLTGIQVAPFVGAWIETPTTRRSRFSIGVAPFVGAWIETLFSHLVRKALVVAPFVGAWIETVEKIDRSEKG